MSLAKISPGNQPDRLFISSDDAIDVPVNSQINGAPELYSYNTFTIPLKEPILRCDGLQLASFVQPNAPADGPCIPDYQASAIGFCYYKQATANTAPVDADLRVLYLLASSADVVSYPSDLANWNNRFFSSYSDFVVALNNAAVALAAGPAGGPDVEFYWDSTERKIAMRGLDNTKYYMTAGYDDIPVRNWIASQAPTYGWSPIPYGYTLNVRVGFTAKNYRFANQKPGGTNANNYIYPFGFPNLVRTGSISVRTNFTYQSTANTKDQRDLLAVVPVSVPFLGVNNFQYNLNHYLCNIPESIQQITIRMYDDQGQPYPVLNSVQTTIELLTTYGGAMVVQ